MRKLIILLAVAASLGASAQLNPVHIALQTWATGMNAPVYATHAGDDRLFVVLQDGVIKIVTDSMQVLPVPFLDISAEVNSNAGEQGLLGLAFDPGYPVNGFFYVYYIHGAGSGASRISRFQVSSDPNVADPSSEVVLYSVPQPYWNHNGGCLQFGPDGYLYCGFGDGGSGNDPDGNGQNLGVPLGKMIRLDVSQHNSTFAIPPDNPFAAAQDTLPEIWASGLRNPWRYSFDRLTGDLWIGDVGQNAWEEVDFWPAGANSGPNFGWRCREGFVPTPDVSQAGCAAAGPFVEPVAAFDHQVQGWCSVIGGYVYRGSAFPHLYGKYIFTDFCSGDFLTFGPDYAVDTLLLDGNTNAAYSSFAEDVDGELYVTDMAQNKLMKIVDACPMPDPEISFDGETLATTAAGSWQWLLNGVPVVGATGQSYVPLVNGAYQVQVNFGDPCLLHSDTMVVATLGIQQIDGFQFSVYPQPASTRLELRHQGPKPAYEVALLDAVGHVVVSAGWAAPTAVLSLDVSGIAAGIYVLRGRSAGDGAWERMVLVGR